MKLNKFINQILIRLSSAIEILLSYDDRSNNYKENYNYKKNAIVFIVIIQKHPPGCFSNAKINQN